MKKKNRTSEEIVHSIVLLAMQNKKKLKIVVAYFSQQNMVDVRVYKETGSQVLDETLLFEHHELTDVKKIELLESKLIGIIHKNNKNFYAN